MLLTQKQIWRCKQWNKSKEPDMSTHTPSNFIFNKRAVSIQTSVLAYSWGSDRLCPWLQPLRAPSVHIHSLCFLEKGPCPLPISLFLSLLLCLSPCLIHHPPPLSDFLLFSAAPILRGQAPPSPAYPLLPPL